MISLIRQIRDGGRARILLSSHLLRDVEECCDEILVLKTGTSPPTVIWKMNERRTVNLSSLKRAAVTARRLSKAIGNLGCDRVSGERRLKLISRRRLKSAICIVLRSKTACRFVA
jgi:ABC-2 type transport system ATP-binding protein